MTPTQEAIAGAVRRLLSPFSRLMHHALDRFELPILSGLNRGRHWRIGSGVIACWLGSYETDEMAVFGGLIEPGDTVYDLGAHSGYFTLLASKLTGPAGKVVAVEPHPLNLKALQRNLDINQVSNVTLLDKAIIDRHDGEVGMSADTAGFGYAGTVVQSGGTFTVRTATLDGLIAAGAPYPDVIKMDVEAMEAAVCDGAPKVLAGCRTRWLISMHEHSVAVRTVEALRASGHDVYNLDGPPVPFGTPTTIDYPEYFWVVLALPAGTPVPRVGRWKQ